MGSSTFANGGDQLASVAAQYDPRLRVIVLNSDGTVATVHFVDQQLAFALGVPLNSIPSMPGFGIDLQSIKKATAANVQLVVRNAVTRAAALLLQRRSVSLGSITATRSPGRTFWTVEYQNLVAPAPRRRSAQVNFGG